MKSGFWNNLTLARKGIFVAVLPVACMLLGFAALYGLASAERLAQRRIDHTLEVRNQISAARTGIVEEESAAHAYALVQNERFLDSAREARAEVTKSLGRLAGLTADNYQQQQKVSEMRGILSRRGAMIDQALTEAKEAGSDRNASRDELFLAIEEQTVNIQSSLSEMDNEESLLHSQRTARLEQLRDIDVAASAATVALGIGGGFFSLYLVSRSMVRRIQAIGRNAQQLAAEQPLVEDSDGSDEIGQLNEQLKAASGLLSSRTRALRESEARLHSILDNSSSIVFMKDLEGRFIMANRQLEKTFGLMEQTIIGRDVHALFPKEFADLYRANDQKALESKEPLQFEEITPQADGEHTYLSIKFALRDAAGKPYAICGIATDITERKRAEQVLRESHGELGRNVQERTAELQATNTRLLREVAEHRETAERLKRTNAQLLQAQKMEALGQIAGGIAHDFNNILTTIMGYGMLLLQGIPEEKREGSPVGEILRAAGRAGALSKQLLSFSRPQPTAPTIVCLNRIIRDSEKMLVQAVGDRITLKVTLAHSLGNVRVDPSQMDQLLLNLAINARDAISGTGEIELKTEEVILRPEEIKRETEAKEFIALSMRDSGVGIPPELMARMFEPFFTTKRPGQGTGLGLATCSAIVQQSEGWIECQSQPGKGTCFTIYLPRVAAPVETPAVSPTNGAIPKGRETLLVVEDEPAVGNLFECLLTGLGYTVIRAGDGEQAEQTIADRGAGAIDLVLTDLDMPHMDGNQLVRRLVERNRGVKVILTSGNGEHFGTGEVADPAFEFLPKPFSMQTLAQKVREVLDR